MLRPRPRKSSGKFNFLALFVSAASLGVIICSFDPVPAGEDLVAVRVADPPDVPLPPEAVNFPAVTTEVGERDSEVAIETQKEAAGPAVQSGMVLDNNEAVKFSLLLMQDGCRFMENIDTYSTTFTKRERIAGDLGDAQTIEMKVRHDPSFSVYMRWRSGDTGRQLLYNDDYPDKKMVVKLGGFKGRLLPAIKLDPMGSEAMGEARYPVTQAGVLGMLRLLVVHRQTDVKNGQGVRCLRLKNMVCDERDCYCFLYEYESPKFNPTYRKSIVMLDTRYHIPLRVINHTWTNSAEELLPAELDEQTLIEDYSFSRLDFGREMVAEDFSRDNPAYRM